MADDDRLALDDIRKRFSDFYSLRHTDSHAADAVLNDLGASDEADRQIILELAAPKPVWKPGRLLEAHALVVRGLEVLDRNATRRVPVPRVGPLAPVLRFVIELVTRFIVRSYLRSVTVALHRLYVRREANCLPGDMDRPLLRKARIDMDRLIPGFKRNPLGIPTFLLGGAALSTILSWLQDAFGLFGSSSVATLIATGVLFLVALVASWGILRGAAVAHRRVALTIEQPLKALYETIGRAGRPPRDQAGVFAIVSISLLVLGLLVIPLGLALTVFT
jgi:hypothetical protein